MKIPSQPPESCNNYVVNLLSLLLFFGAVPVLRACLPQLPTWAVMAIALVVTVVPLWLYDFLVLKVHKRASTGLGAPGAFDRRRLVIKLIGLFAVFLIIGIAYSVLPFYRKPFYAPFFSLLDISVPVILLLSAVYFAFIDRRQIDPLRRILADRLFVNRPV